MAEWTIREATPDDAEAIIAFMKVIVDEPDNGILFESAVEFNWSLADARTMLKNHLDADNSLWPVAVTPDGELIGHVKASGGHFGAYGTLSLAITVAKDWRNKGVGTALMQHVIAWCRANPVVRRLQLYVFGNNPRAIHVYEKLGFQHEGVSRSAYKKQGEWLDFINMAIIFDEH